MARAPAIAAPGRRRSAAVVIAALAAFAAASSVTGCAGSTAPAPAGQSATLAPTAAPTPAAASGQRVTGPRSYLYVVPASGGPARPLLPPSQARELTDVSDPAWSPDGRWIAFTAGCPVCTPRLYLVSASGRGLREVRTGPGAVHSPGWSPDGHAIVFARQRGEDQFIVAVSLATGRVRVVNSEPETADNTDSTPSWSPDGRTIVFAREIHHEDVTLWLVPAAGGPRRPLVPHNKAFDQSHPQWSPDGTKVVFMQTVVPSVIWDLFVLDRSTGALTRITDDPHNEFDPAWAPGGRSIVFASDAASRTGFRALYVIGAAGTGLRRLTFGPADDSMPSWSPDGREIVFVRRPTTRT